MFPEDQKSARRHFTATTQTFNTISSTFNKSEKNKRALGRSPEENVKGHSGAIYRGPLMLYRTPNIKTLVNFYKKIFGISLYGLCQRLVAWFLHLFNTCFSSHEESAVYLRRGVHVGVGKTARWSLMSGMWEHCWTRSGRFDKMRSKMLLSLVRKSIIWVKSSSSSGSICRDAWLVDLL